MPDSTKPPKRSKGDAAHKLVKGALSTIPAVGGPAAELFAAIVQPPLDRRRDEWMASVGEALDELRQTKGIDLESLREDDEFIDTVLQASQIALRHSPEEKRQALRAAIVNTATGGAPDRSLCQMFLRYVDELTEWHLGILKLFDDPEGWFSRSSQGPLNLSMGGLSSLIERAFPPLRNARAIYDQIWADLWQRGVVTTESVHTMMSGHGLMARRTSDLGQRFLRFIEAPPE